MNQQKQSPQPSISQQPQPSLQPEMPKKPNLPNWASILIITVVVIIVGLVSYGAYRYFVPQPEPGELPTAGEEELIDEFADWQTYRNEIYGFEFKYPMSWGEIIETIEVCGNSYEVSNPPSDYISNFKSNYINPRLFYVINWKDCVIPSGPGEFYMSGAKNTWEARKQSKNLHKTGDECLDEEIGFISDVAKDEVTCIITKTNTLYIFEIDKIIKDSSFAESSSIIVTEDKEITFTVPLKYKTTLDQILATFKFIDKSVDQIKEDECNFVDGCEIFESEKFGIRFKYRKGNTYGSSIIEERDNEIVSLLPSHERYLENCEENEFCKIINNKPYSQDAGSIMIFSKSEDETIEEAIQKLIEQEGKNPENCKIVETETENKYLKTLKIDSVEPIVIDDKEIEGEHWMTKIGLQQEKLTELCSSYAQGDGFFTLRIFLYNENRSKTKFIFLPSTGIDQPFFDVASIEFL